MQSISAVRSIDSIDVLSAEQRVPEASVHPVLELRSAVDALEELDPAEATDAALASHLVRLRREIDRLEGVFARQAFAGHRRGVAAHDGHRSTVAWLGWKTGMRMVDAHLAINAGRSPSY